VINDHENLNAEIINDSVETLNTEELNKTINSYNVEDNDLNHKSNNKKNYLIIILISIVIVLIGLAIGFVLRISNPKTIFTTGANMLFEYAESYINDATKIMNNHY